MPLHLLGKKSWNVYNTDNIERVKRDEAIAAAHEEKVERLMQEHDAAKRLAILRGATIPRTPTPLPAPDFRNRDKPTDVERKIAGQGGRERKKRKLAGEDDTDLEIRLARVQREDAEKARESITDGPLKKRKENNSSLYDTRGHINLFAVDEIEVRKAQRQAEVVQEKRKKKQEAETANSMRFSDAGGRGKAPPGEGPWYASSNKPIHGVKGESGAVGVALSEQEELKDVWGRTDPTRKRREGSRVVLSDPLAFMKNAQMQLKQAERDRKSWADQRERENVDLDAAARRHERSRRRRSCSRSNSLDGFNLDMTRTELENSHRRHPDTTKAHEQKSRSSHQREERDRHESSCRHHPSRSRSRDRGRKYGGERRSHRNMTHHSHHDR